ncbi:hypothetical protein O6H91_09G071500 [Diphasiastrum complanatum]|uniref:Uncharacterized protein n=2 Tax=Diphasiastrum complanatum TaxID=34168 RepID=A0ACC2CQH5_DIPCM|nr:hypothetical protein O6H91_09G070800 [Diphasiastrum complanatum]KAJ7544264.1 hypothetical protein O6H91_09G071500 [Diphasiastrum complanatum]
MAASLASQPSYLHSSFFGTNGNLSWMQTEASTSSRPDYRVVVPSHRRPRLVKVRASIQRNSKELEISPNATPMSSFNSMSCSFSEEWWRKAPHCSSKNETRAHCVAENGLSVNFFSQRESDVEAPSTQKRFLKEYPFHETPTSRGRSGGVPVFVMLPLDSVNTNNQLTKRRALNASLLALKSAGVEGVMMDIWWGVVEKDRPREYRWSAYRELMEMARKHGLKVQAVMSFHQCGGNVGDSCFVPLPQWIVEEIKKNPDLVYTDKDGRRNYEYLSLGCDIIPVLRGRTPVQVYSDFMRSFRDNFEDMFGDTIVEVQVGLGPAGEMRYPSYPERDGIWRFPGNGEFQCYDKYMLASLKANAEAAGRPEWGLGGPHDAGHYNQWPEDAGFFRREGAWNSSYGNFFLEWYSGLLLDHGERILTAAEAIFRGTGVCLSGKIAGIHWHYGTRSHPPELTAGYYNTRFRDGYLPIARMFGRHGVTFNFTCFEMKDFEQPSEALCSPERLLSQVVKASRKAGIALAGENALPRFDDGAYEQIVIQSRLQVKEEGRSDTALEPMCSFTFLRMSESMFQPDNWRRFVPFVRHMAEGRTFQPWEEEHRVAESFVHATRPLIQEAAAALV